MSIKIKRVGITPTCGGKIVGDQHMPQLLEKGLWEMWDFAGEGWG